MSPRPEAWPIGRAAGALLGAGVLLTLAIVVIPDGSPLAQVWIAGPILWLAGTLGLLWRLGARPPGGGAGWRAALVVGLTAPWVTLGASYTLNILRQGLPFDIAHLILPPALLVSVAAAWSLRRLLAVRAAQGDSEIDPGGHRE